MVVIRCGGKESAARVERDGVDILEVALPGITDLLPVGRIPLSYGGICSIAPREKP
jgi:hypothetical protein